MNGMRTITLGPNNEETAELRESTGAEFFSAVGYLSSWCMGRYPTLSIWIDTRNYELNATYRNDDGSVGYAIGAVWSDASQKFSFHS